MPTSPNAPPVPLLGLGDGGGRLYTGMRAFALPPGWTIAALPQAALSGLSGSGGQLTGYFQLQAPASASQARVSLFSGGGTGGDGVPPALSTTAITGAPNGAAFRVIHPPVSSPLPGATKVLFSVDIWPSDLANGYAALEYDAGMTPTQVPGSLITATAGSGVVSLTADITAWALGLTVATPVVLLLWSDPPTSTVAAGSDGMTLPQTTIDLVNAVNFNSSGGQATITGAGISGSTTVTYSGQSSSPQSLQGCSGGSGTLHTGDVVTGTAGGPLLLSQAELIYSL